MTASCETPAASSSASFSSKNTPTSWTTPSPYQSGSSSFTFGGPTVCMSTKPASHRATTSASRGSWIAETSLITSAPAARQASATSGL